MVEPDLEEEMEPIDVKAAQRALLELGYYDARVDGIAGPKTKAAIRAFQKDRKLQITGDLNRDVVQTLLNSAAGARQRLSSFTGLARPVYEAGDRFYYSDGSSETVLSMEGERVVWESSDGTRRTAPRNFILPPFAWYSERGSGSAEAEISPDVLWPLKPGEEVRYSTSATVMDASPDPEGDLRAVALPRALRFARHGPGGKLRCAAHRVRGFSPARRPQARPDLALRAGNRPLRAP